MLGLADGLLGRGAICSPSLHVSAFLPYSVKTYHILQYKYVEAITLCNAHISERFPEDTLRTGLAAMAGITVVYEAFLTEMVRLFQIQRAL